ncbi:TetR family transcriptional regulator [Sphingomonas crusticola]|uniref:TetR family transcriptional regulator n=1 Tax=Sphingomonas crusticola TaxID=1697973 RepID=UPI000E262498|nr:TetR family transcriptional regulator [Sphingomonas crusticola]
MNEPRKSRISALKEPKQARSIELVAAILEAAVHVLEREGAQRFTTARVAEKAGVSVGSLYQYFPNKAAILFRLQSDEWRETMDMLRAILDDTGRPPLDRLRALVHAFIRSECAEAGMRTALDDAAPLYRNAPEAQAAKAGSDRIFLHFMREALPHAVDAEQELAADMIKATLSNVGANFSASPRTEAEIARYGDAMADMFCAYLRDIC